jgi:hypothetical protein
MERQSCPNSNNQEPVQHQARDPVFARDWRVFSPARWSAGTAARRPLRFTASGDVLSEVQTKIDGDLALVRRFLTAQGYQAQAIELGRLEVADTRSREYAAQNGGPRFILAQTVIVRTNFYPAWRATAGGRDLVLLDRGGQLAFTAPADGDFTIRLEYPRYRGLSLTALFALLLGAWMLSRV